MTTGISHAALKRLWPNAPEATIAAVAEQSVLIFPKYGINTPLRVAHFMAQLSHESGGGTVTSEDLNYKTATRIAAVWPSRFTAVTAVPYVRNPKKLAAKVYNGRMGNRPGTDDGYTFRGRGLLQITGRSSYQEMAALTGLDLVNNPDLAFAPENALEIAAAEFQKLNCLPACDRDDCKLVTKRVNGGYNGLASRVEWLAKWKTALPSIADTPRAVRQAMEVVPRGADDEQPAKGMASSTEGNTALGGGALGLLQTVSDASGTVSTIKQNSDSAGLTDIVLAVISSPKFLIGVAIVAVCIFLWLRRRYRLRFEVA